jgi:single-strand DNA-binding protein
MNEAQVFVAGYVAREPKFRKTHNGYSYTSLRVGYTPRRMDRDSGEWSDGGTSFVTVFCWRRLADNVATCVRKGDPVLIKGKLQVRPYTDKDGAARVAVEVEASSIGHDLARGVANFQRAHRTAGETALERAAAEGRADEPGAPDPAADGVPSAAPGGMFAEDAVAALSGAAADDPDEDAEQAADDVEPEAGPETDAEPVGAETPF